MEPWHEELWIERPEIYELKDVNIKPVILKNVPVIYPHDAIEKKLSGKVIVEVVINEKGFVIEANIYKGLHDTIEMSLYSSDESNVLIKKSNITSSLDLAALDAAKRTRFDPAFINGKRVKSITYIPFTLVTK